METLIITICSLATGISLFYVASFLSGKNDKGASLIQKRRLHKIKNREYTAKHVTTDVEITNQRIIGQALLYYKETFKFAFLAKILNRFSFTVSIENLLRATGSKMPVDIFILISLVTSLLLFLVGYIILPLGIISGVLMGVLGLTLPTLRLKLIVSKAEKLFMLQLPDALGLITSSLRAGHSLTSALMIVANELQNPIASMFKRVVDEINLGREVKSAFDELSHSMPNSLDLKFFITAVLIQREIGGNLAEILDSLNATIRERIKFAGQLKVQTAQAKLSGLILGFAPFGVGGIIYMVNPKYMEPLFTQFIGQACIVVSVVITVIGFFLIKKITAIEV